MSHATDTETKLTGNTYVRLGAAVFTIALLLGFVIRETTFRTNLTRDIQQMQASISKLTKVMEDYRLPEKLSSIEARLGALEGKSVPDRFHKTEMRLWILQTEKLNQNWKAAPLTENEVKQ
jgi:hypothetical protein